MSSRQCRRLKFLRNLRQVSMSCQTIGTYILIDFSIVRTQRQTPSRTTHTRLSINNHIRSNHASSQCRHETKYSRCSLTSRISNQCGSLNTLSVPFAQPIHSRLQQSRCGSHRDDTSSRWYAANPKPHLYRQARGTPRWRRRSRQRSVG